MPAALTLLEVAVQGVAGLPNTARFALRPGFNQFEGTPEAEDAFSRALWALLFADLAFATGPSARAALSFLAGDGATYRLLAAVGAPPVLSRLGAGGGKFESVTPDGGIGRLLREWGLPERRLFEALFLLSAPPTAAKAASSSRSGPGPDSGPRIESKFAELADQLSQAKVLTDPGEIRARLREVEREDREASEMETLQFQVDGLQQQLFQAEDALKIFDQLSADVARVEKDLAAMPTVSEDLVAQVKRLPQLTLKRDEALKRVVDERLELEQLGGEVTLAGLASDRLFAGSILTGAACLALAIVASPASPGMRWISLGDVPAFGIAAAMAIQRLSDIRRTQGVGRKLDLLQEREARIQKAFETESRDVIALMKSLGVEGIAELEDRLAARNVLLQRRAEADAQLKRAEAEDAAEGRRVLRDRLRTQVAEIEQQLAGFGGYRRDRGEIRKEQDDLKGALAKLSGGTGSGLETALDDDGPPKDDGAGLLRHAGEVLAMSPAMTLQTIRDRLTQYLGALSNRQFSGANFAPDGRLLLLPPGGEAVPFAQLPPLEQRAALAALRLCLVERYLQNHRLFVICDERSDGLDAQRRDLCVKLLKGLTRFGQVLWIGQAGAAAADHRVSLAG